MAHQQQRALLPLPSPAQIALALVTVRSKPAHVTIEGSSQSCFIQSLTDAAAEHLSNIRRSIATNPAVQGLESSTHINAVRFWKEAFLRTQNEKQQLQDEILKLQQDADRRHLPATGSTKRKAESSVLNMANTQSKRTKAGKEKEEPENAFSEGEGEHESEPGQYASNL